MLIQEIKSNWKTDILGYAQVIPSLKNTEYPAWTVKLIDGYGVAIPYSGENMNENFSNARIFSADNIMTSAGVMQRSLVLSTESIDIEGPFATLCAELIDPGTDGSARATIQNDPVAWWKKWKELLGNRNIDARIYDTLGELCVLYELLKSGEDANWNGPDGATYDIETDFGFIEVKSTISRRKKEITLSNKFQLFPPNKPLNVVLCVFEPTVQTGFSINSIIAKFDEIGYNTQLLNRKLSEKRIFPAIDILKTGTRRDDLLLTADEQEAVENIRRATNSMKADEAVERILDLFARTKTNEEFISHAKKTRFV